MKRTDYKPQYRRNLPHYQPAGFTIFVTIRLTGTLPRHVFEKLRSETRIVQKELDTIPDTDIRLRQKYQEKKRLFGKLNTILDKAKFGPSWLKNPNVATVVYESICFRDGRFYTLDAFTVMPNHVHILFRPLETSDGDPHSLSSIMMSLKRHTARECNKLLGRTGQFWQHESFDHVVRDLAERERIVKYILDNPVKAGLVEDWREWPWSFLRED
jgi:REP element-mobilizing transposase RayT